MFEYLKSLTPKVFLLEITFMNSHHAHKNSKVIRIRKLVLKIFDVKIQIILRFGKENLSISF